LVLPARNPKNYRKRGFDPAKSLAKRALIIAGINIPIITLSNVRSRMDQRGLGRQERAKNVAGSMRLTVVHSGKVALFDDVVTTGSTLLELARACEAAGVKVTVGCVLAQRNAQS
jgi:predicted amidophosphoribosyltransferase